MRVHKGKVALIAVTAAAIAVAGCSSSGSPKGSSTGGHGKLIYGEATAFPENLMPLIAAGNSTATADIEARLLNGPFRVTPQLVFQADPNQVVGQPTSTISNGQQVVTYKINPKAVWDDGKPITEADYAYTWSSQKSSDPKTGGCASLLGTTGYDQIASVKAGSTNKTVVVTFEKGKPYPDWRGLFSPLLSQHVFDKGSPAADCAYITKGWPLKTGIPAGATNGPWVLTANNINTQGQSLTETHNAKWWGTPAKLAQLVIAYVGSDPNTNVTAMQNQEVSMVYPQPQLDLVASMKKLANVTTQINFGIDFEHFDFNVKDPLLAHKQIREAIALSIDRKALVAATVGKFSDKAQVLDNRLLMTNQPGYKAQGGMYDSQNIAKAKQLLTSVGCTLGTVDTCFGKPLKFTIITTQQNPLRDQTIAIAAQQVKAAGIQLKEYADPNIFAGPTDANSLASEQFQIALFAWVGSPSIASNGPIYLSPKGGGVGQNYSQGGTPQIDATIGKMTTATSTGAETTYANQVDALLWQQMYTLPLYQKPDMLSYDSNYSGIVDNPTNAGPLWDSDTIVQKS